MATTYGVSDDSGGVKNICKLRAIEGRNANNQADGENERIRGTCVSAKRRKRLGGIWILRHSKLVFEMFSGCFTITSLTKRIKVS